jgi:hypothetical protein
MWARLWSLYKQLWNRINPQVQTPLKVRLLYGLPILAIYVFYLDVPWQNKFAIYGIISTVLGAGVLFGESIVSNGTCLRMAEDFINRRPSPRARKIALIWLPLALVTFVLAWAAHFVYTYHRDATYEEYWETAYALALIVVPAALLYYLTAVCRGENHAPKVGGAWRKDTGRRTGWRSVIHAGLARASGRPPIDERPSEGHRRARRRRLSGESRLDNSASCANIDVALAHRTGKQCRSCLTTGSLRCWI